MIKSFGALLKKKKLTVSRAVLDEKTAFSVFREVIREEFGSQGMAKLTPDYFSGKTIFVKSQSSAWGSELWLTRQEIMRKINRKLGGDFLAEIKLK